VYCGRKRDDAGSGRDQGATAAELCNGAGRGRALRRSAYDEIVNEEGVQQVRGEKILIACGTRPAHIDGIPVDGKRILIPIRCMLGRDPRELIVVGAGIIGWNMRRCSPRSCEGDAARPASDAARFCRSGIIESLCFQLRQLGAVFRLGEKVVSVGFDEDRDKVFAVLESGKKVRGQALLYTIGRQANSDN